MGDSVAVQGAVNRYKRVSLDSEVTAASPHRLIQMLYEGALRGLALARGAIERKDVAAKCEQIVRVHRIVDSLRACLDHEQGGELCANLDSLYEYMGTRLIEANLGSDAQILDEISKLLQTLKAGWDGIANAEAARAMAGDTNEPGVSGAI